MQFDTQPPADPALVARIVHALTELSALARETFAVESMAVNMHSVCAWCSHPIKSADAVTWFHLPGMDATPWVHHAEPRPTIAPHEGTPAEHVASHEALDRQVVAIAEAMPS